MEGVGGCPKFIVLSTGPLSVPNYNHRGCIGRFEQFECTFYSILDHLLLTFTFFSLLLP